MDTLGGQERRPQLQPVCLDLISWPLVWVTAEVTDKVKCCRQYTDTQEFCPSTVQVHKVHKYNYSTQKNRSSVLVQFTYIKYIYIKYKDTQEFCSSTVQVHIVHIYNYSTQKNMSSVLVQITYIKYIYSTKIQRRSVLVQFTYI